MAKKGGDTAVFSSWYRLLELQLVSQHKSLAPYFRVICFDAAWVFPENPVSRETHQIGRLELNY